MQPMPLRKSVRTRWQKRCPSWCVGKLRWTHARHLSKAAESCFVLCQAICELACKAPRMPHLLRRCASFSRPRKLHRWSWTLPSALCCKHPAFDHDHACVSGKSGWLCWALCCISFASCTSRTTFRSLFGNALSLSGRAHVCVHRKLHWLRWTPSRLPTSSWCRASRAPPAPSSWCVLCLAPRVARCAACCLCMCCMLHTCLMLHSVCFTLYCMCYLCCLVCVCMPLHFWLVSGRHKDCTADASCRYCRVLEM